MYKIKGYDQREYGPVSEQEMRQWIAQGRANARTMVQKEGSAEWKSLSTFPEFSSLLPSVAEPSKSPPLLPGISTASQDSEALAAEIIRRGYTVDIGSCISRGWQLVKANFWLTVGTTLLVMLAQGVIPLLLDGVFMGGLFGFYLKLIRGKTADPGDGFSGFSLALTPLLLAGIISRLLTFTGLLLCLLPGIYLAVAWVFVFPLVIDKKLDFWEAMEVSRKVINRNWWKMFGLVLVAGLVGISGFLGCCIGVYLTMPIMFAALAYAYEDIFGDGAQKTA